MVSAHHLQTKLKRLRLGGMSYPDQGLDTLEIRLGQVQQHQLGYLEFLELMLEDEITRREQKGLAYRIALAHFEEVKTLEEFDFAFNPKIPPQKVRDLATPACRSGRAGRCHFIEAGESVIVCGPVGTGKSHLLQAIGHSACRQGHKVLYTRASRMLAHLGGLPAGRQAATRTAPGTAASAPICTRTCSSSMTFACASSPPSRPRISSS